MHQVEILALFGVHLPPNVALLITLAFVGYLFRRDLLETSNVTGALWIPFFWMTIIGSRSVTQWLHILHFPISLGSAEEGNPVDALFYFGLIGAGMLVLSQRQLNLGELFRNNGWLVAFLIYCFLAILWSDFPFVAFKRWIKILGHPVMALIIFTEPNPGQALTTLMKRSAYLLAPFSILLIKYFPDIGRGFDQWSGIAMNVGACNSKNMLGCVSMILGFFFFWHFLNTWRSERGVARRRELWLTGILLVMIGWLLWKAHSATSAISLMVAVAVVFLLERRWVNKQRLGTYVILLAITLGVAELSFGIFEKIADLTGHESTLMGRSELWGELLALHTNPIFGTGFESFWLGDLAKPIWDVRWWHVDEAHNGYLEVYLDLGLVGLFLLWGTIIATFRKIRGELLINPEWGGYRLGFLVAVVIYNWTEATFKGLSLVWFVFYIIALDYPVLGSEIVTEPSEAVEREEELEWEYSEDRV